MPISDDSFTCERDSWNPDFVKNACSSHIYTMTPSIVFFEKYSDSWKLSVCILIGFFIFADSEFMKFYELIYWRAYTTLAARAGCWWWQLELIHISWQFKSWVLKSQHANTYARLAEIGKVDDVKMTFWGYAFSGWFVQFEMFWEVFICVVL